MSYFVLPAIFLLLNIYLLIVLFYNKKSPKYLNPKHLLIGLIAVFSLIQICTGLAWMLFNHNYIQQFGDTAEYLNLSKSMKFDEYRMILYPLFLVMCEKTGAIFGISQTGMIYFIQTIISFFSFFYFSYVFLHAFLRRISNNTKNLKPILFYSTVFYISLFLVTIPVVTQYNLAILVDSLSLSFIVISLTAMTDVLFLGKSRLFNYVIIGISMLLQFQLRIERKYVFILLLFFFFLYLYKSVKTFSEAFKRVLPFVIILIVALSANTIINKQIQQPGLYNRPLISPKSQLLFLPLWPNFELCYDDFPEEFKNTFTIEEMKNVDQNANLMIYGIYPKLADLFGAEKANDLIFSCDVAIIKNYPDRLITRAAYNVIQYILSPLQIVFNINGITAGASEWNFSRMYEATPAMTTFYYKSSLYMFIILLITSIASAIKICKKAFSPCLSLLSPLLTVCVAISMVFGLLNASPANYRYLLIGHVFWYMLMVVSIFCIIEVNEKPTDKSLQG